VWGKDPRDGKARGQIIASCPPQLALEFGADPEGQLRHVRKNEEADNLLGDSDEEDKTLRNIFEGSQLLVDRGTDMAQRLDPSEYVVAGSFPTTPGSVQNFSEKQRSQQLLGGKDVPLQILKPLLSGHRKWANNHAAVVINLSPYNWSSCACHCGVETTRQCGHSPSLRMQSLTVCPNCASRSSCSTTGSNRRNKKSNNMKTNNKNCNNNNKDNSNNNNTNINSNKGNNDDNDDDDDNDNNSNACGRTPPTCPSSPLRMCPGQPNRQEQVPLRSPP
jgi:hypothetical protein